MKFKALVKSIGTTIYNQRSNIEFVAGNLMVVGGTAMIMTKAEDAVEVKHEYEFAKKSIELKDENNDWENEKERKKECFDAAKNAAVGYAKCYGPGLAVEAGGLVLMAISKATDRKELAVTSAALASTAMEFANYRQKVRDEFGDEKDEQLYLGSARTQRPLIQIVCQHTLYLLPEIMLTGAMILELTSISQKTFRDG